MADREEKIGKVILDERLYSGTDLYSDGQVEDELLEIAQNFTEEEFNHVIADRNSWPVLYHFSHVRQNILEWLPITKKDHVLEIGSGCGAMTGLLARKAGKVSCVELSRKRSLINAYRNRECENIRIHVGNFQDIEPTLEETFDYITLIGVFEYAEAYISGAKDPYVEMLKRISRHLKPDGKLVVAIENRLGLKYFAGCSEDHVGTYFEGLEGYPNTSGVRTFSRKELTDLFQKSEESFQLQFYYPYPDYKFPLSIYSDKRLPKKGEIKENFQNFDRVRMQLFHEPLVYDSLTDAGVFSEFSNSFLVVAGKQSDNVCCFTKYANERGRSYAVRTEILEENEKRYIRKTPIYPEGYSHVKKIPEYEEKLNAIYERKLVCNHCITKTESGGIELEYLEGTTLAETLDTLLTEHQVSEAEVLLQQYLDLVREIHAKQNFVMTTEFEKVFGTAEFSKSELAAPFSNMDLVCENVIMGEPMQILDYEWTYDFLIPYKYLIYRIIHYYLESGKKRQELSAQEFYHRNDITEELRNTFEKMEAHFQNYVLQGHVPMRDMFTCMTPGNAVSVKGENSQLQIYYSFGAGYQEADSVCYPMQEGKAELTVKLPQNVKFLRLDPGDDPCMVQILKLCMDGKTVDFGNAVLHQGFVRENWIYFSGKDPWIADIPVPEGSRELQLSLECRLMPASAMQPLQQLWTERQSLFKRYGNLEKMYVGLKRTSIWKKIRDDLRKKN